MNVVSTYPLQLDGLDVNVLSRVFDILKKLEGSLPSYYFIEEEGDGCVVKDLRKEMFMPHYRNILQQYMEKLADLPTLKRLFA